jgi:mannose-1-phosphate guanylyltransferase
MRLFPVIMAGGSGTRFWPLSRAARPKQFLSLATERPLIVETFRRMKGLAAPRDTFVVCGKLHAPQVRKMIPQLPKQNVLVEPAARNTAPAIGLATLHVAEKDPSGIVAVLPSDHHVANVPRFQELISTAAEVAQAGHLVTLGIKPSRPETGYGYIKVGEPLLGQSHRVAAFVEKPDAETARRYLEGGDYLWNGGIFVFRADVMLQAIAKHMPELARGLDSLRASLGGKKYAAALAKVFPKLPSISIDYGVMEKAEDIAVLPAEFGWSDVGSFEAISEVRPKDDRGNVVTGDGALAIDCSGCVVIAKDKPVAAIGLTDVVVVDAGDAFLVVPKKQSQDVRKAVEALKARKAQKFL